MSSQQKIGMLIIWVLFIVSLVMLYNIFRTDFSMPPPAAVEGAPQANLTMPQTDKLIGQVGLLFLLEGIIVLIYFKTFGYKPLKKD